jgi:hypothetical protein
MRKELKTIPEAARATGLTASSLRRWAALGLIPGARRMPGGRFLLPATFTGEDVLQPIATDGRSKQPLTAA